MTQPYSITIGGSSVYVIEGTLDINKAIGQRSTAHFSVLTAGPSDLYGSGLYGTGLYGTSTYTHFQQYQRVSIYDQNGTLTFSGYIDTVKETKPGYQAYLVHEITCMDQRWLADKRVIFDSGLAPNTTLAPSPALAPGGTTQAKVYTNRPYDVIAYDIFSKYLAPEGVSMGMIFTGPYPSPSLAPSTTLTPNGPSQVIAQVTFNFPSATQALDALVASASADGVTFYWDIDENKKFWFVPYAYVVNSTVVDGTHIDQVNNAPYVTRSNPLYRNTQYVVGGTTNGAGRTEYFIGDSNKRTWVLAWPVATQPNITVNNVSQSVGVEGQGVHNFYYKVGSDTITQDSSRSLLTSSNSLVVDYVPMYPNTSTGLNSAQVTAQKALDGSTGIVESVLKDTNITSNKDGNIEANYLLNVYSPRGTQFVFSTLATGYAQGQQITVNYAPFNFSSTKMLIQSIHTSDQQDGINMWNTITAIVGPFDTTWAQFFNKILLPAGSSTAGAISVGA